jgi:hypothetical protein
MAIYVETKTPSQPEGNNYSEEKASPPPNKSDGDSNETG